MSIESGKLPHQELEDHLKQKYPELHGLRIEKRGDDLRLDHLVVKKEHRKQGIGHKVMNDITDHADKHGHRMTLTTGVKDPHFGTTSASRLKGFYKEHGFVENKGRNKDFTISDNMIREPKVKRQTFKEWFYSDQGETC